MVKLIKNILVYGGLFLMTLLLCVILIVLSGSSISTASAGFFRGAFGSAYAVSEVLVRATPLILAGLGISVCFRSGFVNIGAEGQLYMGAIAASVIALSFPDSSAFTVISMALFAGFLFGGIWSLIPGLLKAYFGISEVINTLLFNYISINLVGILVRTLLKDPVYPYPMSPGFSENSYLPVLLKSTRLHAGILIAVALVFIVWLLVWRTFPGYEMRAVGLNPRACRCAGISTGKNILLSSLIGGGLAGIAGVCEVLGLHHKLLEGISPGYGYIAIIAALLGGNHPLGVVLSALGIAVLQVGSLSMQRAAGVPTSISSILMGVLVLLVISRKLREGG